MGRIIYLLDKQIIFLEKNNNNYFIVKEEGIMTILKNFLRQDEGVTAIEYGMIAALIALLIIVGVTAIGKTLSVIFGNIATSI